MKDGGVRIYFNSVDAARILQISVKELMTILLPYKNKLPIFSPEDVAANENSIDGLLFTQRDILKMSRYFRSLKETEAAKAELKSSLPPEVLSKRTEISKRPKRTYKKRKKKVAR